MTQNFLPTPNTEATHSVVTANPAPPQREPLKHLLIGSPQAINRAIHHLHAKGYAHIGEWSPLLPTANPGEVMCILIRYLLLSQD